MSQTTHRLSLLFIQSAQAQKHVTHNEALAVLDAWVQPVALDADRNTSQQTPSEGDMHIVAVLADETVGSVDLADIENDNMIIGTANDVNRSGTSKLGANLIMGVDSLGNALSGGGDDDRILDGSGNDTITGRQDSDMLFGNAGADTFVWLSGDGSDTVDGGDDTDLLTMTGNVLSEADWVVIDTTVTDGTGNVTYSALENIDIDLFAVTT